MDFRITWWKGWAKEEPMEVVKGLEPELVKNTDLAVFYMHFDVLFF